jgi:hypothetical protein
LDIEALLPKRHVAHEILISTYIFKGTLCW